MLSRLLLAASLMFSSFLAQANEYPWNTLREGYEARNQVILVGYQEGDQTAYQNMLTRVNRIPSNLPAAAQAAWQKMQQYAQTIDPDAGFIDLYTVIDFDKALQEYRAALGDAELAPTALSPAARLQRWQAQLELLTGQYVARATSASGDGYQTELSKSLPPLNVFVDEMDVEFKALQGIFAQDAAMQAKLKDVNKQWSYIKKPVGDLNARSVVFVVTRVVDKIQRDLSQ
ncbi:hypothetical protein [Atopomonas sediminilitoris]|uniref:hypothetical protein n=1 Tax=Atopomonas sediminilitoris TaxID=2919919 RepID=UPI001F4E85F5|nr:hypothetical protein [Atopomonas sediminilitoris]MCJ8168671.1 hypothetical protein [Atopomonas sediminilitoris]